MQERDTVSEGARGGIVHALVARLATHRTRRVVACLECGISRAAGADAGECPACGYLGWRELPDATRGSHAVPIATRDTI